ncbi:probable pectinesterase/pectinesterase inhibitor 46 [Phtheirospermum japonicum]|uniref:Pectinesterase n=1 Tax=Phtheirospermum japonicum TaxID=374723 RepID=A0A830CCE7_9LAMI|nr:probable pectinesterase/pectinesterase inhibitor 46 [Phtheirospermum japonicum]
MTPNVVVAADGSGNYTNITEAIKAVPLNSDQSNRRFVIYVKKGVYYENVRVEKEKWNVLIYGDGMHNTIVSSNHSNQTGSSTLSTATFAAYGKGFIAKDIGFVNTAGPANHQAVALMSSSDRSVFYRCLFDGYQDTLYTHTHRQFYRHHRQFYRECKIYGTTDFIFGDAAVVIQNSDILVRKPLKSKTTIVTAQGKLSPYSKTGISIQKTFLGRPWRNYSTVVVMESKLGSLIDPKGWLPWHKNTTAPDTIFYVEHGNVGPGANTDNRVKWKGLRVKDTQNDATNFTVRSLIDGDQWLPATGVPFQADL